MSASARKVSLLALWLVGIGAAFATESVGWARPWQVGLLLVVAAASTSRVVAEGVSRRLDALRHPTRRRRAVAAVCIAVVACAYLLFTGLRQQRDLFPKYHDEHMHLVQMQLLAHGTLWRAPHPLADAFETFHVLTTPVYASIYFPGTAMLYVPAVWLGLPWWLLPLLAAGASVGLFYDIVTELLDGAYALLAVLLLISATQFRYLSLIVMSHTVMILLGLLLVWAYLHWRRERRYGWAIAIGVIAGWAAITRPVDAICWAAPVGLGILFDLRGQPLRRWVSTGALIVAAAAPFLTIQIIFNYGVTGNPLLTPYRYSGDLFTPQVSLGFHRFDPSVKPQTNLLQKQVYFELFTAPTAEEHNTGSMLRTWIDERFPSFVFFTLPSPLLVPLVFASVLALDRRRWTLWLTVPLFLASYAVFAYFIPNYIAIYIAPTTYAALLGVEATIGSFSAARSRLQTFFFGAIAVMALTMLPESNPNEREDFRPSPIMWLNSRLDRDVVLIDGRPDRIQKPAIVLFKYHTTQNPHEEPVYTIDAPWPDDSPIVRAHDLGREKNLELLKYYAERQPERHIYFCDRGRNNAITYAGQAGELWTKWSRVRTATSTSPATQWAQ